jgi:hypothetical protein
MKNFILSVILIAVISAIGEMFLPWWIIAVVGFGVGYFLPLKPGSSFLSGFTAVFLLWVAYAFMLTHANNDILAKKVAMLLSLKGHVMALLLVTGVIGGLVAGFATLSGRLSAHLVSG